MTYNTKKLILIYYYFSLFYYIHLTGVPTNENENLVLLPKNLLKPKSPNFIVPCTVRNIFAGFKS